MTTASADPRMVLRRVLSSVFGSGAMTIAGMGVTFLVGVQLARYMRPEDFGLYSGVLAVFFIAMIAPQLGLPILAMRKIASRTASDADAGGGEIAGLLLFALLVIPLAGGVCTLIASGVLQLYGWTGYGFYGLGLICLYPMIAFGSRVLIGLGHVTLSQGLERLLRPALFALTLYIAHSSTGTLDVAGAMAAHLLSLALATIVIALVVFRAILREHIWAPPHYTVRPWMGAGLPIVGAEIFRSFNAQIGMLISGFFVATASLGDLRIALTIATLFGFPQTVATLAVAPVVARLHAEKDKTGLEKITAVTTVMVAALQLIGFAILFAAGTPLVSIAFGPDYAGAVPPMLVMVLGHVVMGMTGPAGTVLMMAGQERYMFRIVIVVGLAQTALALVLIPSLGVMGAAIAATLAIATQGVLYTLTARRLFTYRLDVLSSFFRLKEALRAG